MSKTINRNLKVNLSNQISWELEKLSNHEVSKTEATKNIMNYVEKTLLKIDVKIENEKP